MNHRTLSPGLALARRFVVLVGLLGLLGACTLVFQDHAPVIATFGNVPPNSIAGQNGVQRLVNETGYY